jgi:uncharacterized Fe-S center protein
MTAKVFFVSSRVSNNRGVIQRFGDLVDRLGLEMIEAGETVAVKVHFGDNGTSAFVRPQFARKVVDRVKAQGAHPFLTDTCTLYFGRRRHAVGHLELALENGFSYATVAAPLIIADGVRSRDVVEVPAPGGATHFTSVKYASAVHHADALLVLSKAKGHLATGFGGALKNLSMGLGSKAMKQAMHATVRPELDEARCEACGECVEVCAEDAVVLEEGIARFDHEACVGCAECIAVCPCGALKLLWNASPAAIQEKMAEVAAAALARKAGKVAFYNFLLEVTPDCDCFPWSDNPVVNNIGVLASTDPVAIDQASADLVNAAPGLASSKLGDDPAALAAGADKWRVLYPKIDWTVQLAHAEALGLGTRRYELVELGD